MERRGAKKLTHSQAAEFHLGMARQYAENLSRSLQGVSDELRWLERPELDPAEILIIDCKELSITIQIRMDRIEEELKNVEA